MVDDGQQITPLERAEAILAIWDEADCGDQPYDSLRQWAEDERTGKPHRLATPDEVVRFGHGTMPDEDEIANTAAALYEAEAMSATKDEEQTARPASIAASGKKRPGRMIPAQCSLPRLETLHTPYRVIVLMKTFTESLPRYFVQVYRCGEPDGQDTALIRAKSRTDAYALAKKVAAAIAEHVE
jgi:hypothetical protein